MMRAAINMEQMGSAIIQPKDWIRREEMITPTLPRVSAKMCRKIPVCVCVGGGGWGGGGVRNIKVHDTLQML